MNEKTTIYQFEDVDPVNRVLQNKIASPQTHDSPSPISVHTPTDLLSQAVL